MTTAETVVWSTPAENVDVVLNAYGFYARCRHCPWVTEETTASKWIARQWAQDHENA